MFADFDDDGQTELVFWNQEDKSLILAEIPNDPRNSGTWDLRTIYGWSTEASHEGLAQTDIADEWIVEFDFSVALLQEMDYIQSRAFPHITNVRLIGHVNNQNVAALD